MGTLGRAIYTVGFWIRETGQAMDRLGCRLQGNYYFQEQLSRHRTLMNLFDKAPVVDKDAFVAPSASIIGDVQVGRGSSIWYGCVLRGKLGISSPPECCLETQCRVVRFRLLVTDEIDADKLSILSMLRPPWEKRPFDLIDEKPGATDKRMGSRGSSDDGFESDLGGDVNSISIGSGTNIQDNSLVHVAKSNLAGKVLPTIIGDNVTVGHSAVLHGCTVEDESFVGMGATLLDGVVVEKHGMVAAGALVRQNTRIPCGEVWGAENSKSYDEIEFEKILRKKFARRDEEYDSMLGVVRETPPELILPDNILPDKAPKAS
ncbi:gamma carbonic anhydrase 2 [Actinidia rufa]|uniref:Gamma carbonic anhydrase 2 n=1 Tax=Actinidia rufa TaxID=165716 RepID=A0A7J0H6Z1_9ERIC|nr:gamma carbonic anhydrase 2 [Actinidia rufa]